MKQYNFITDLPSKSNPDKSYQVKMDEQGNLTCNCPIWIYNRRGNRTCKHTDIVKISGFLDGKGKLITGGKDSYHKSPVICRNYPDQCNECNLRYKCYTETNPEFTWQEIHKNDYIDAV